MNQAQAQLIEAIYRQQTQVKPLLANSVFNRANTHQVMLTNSAEIDRSIVYFVAVKGIKSWAVFYSYSQRSDHYIANHGTKATPTQVQKWMDVEGDLMENYRG